MAIRSQDQLIAGLTSGQKFTFSKNILGPTTPTQGDIYSAWNSTGSPALPANPVAGTQVVPYSGLQGAQQFTNAPGGQVSYLGRLSFFCNVAGFLTVYDRLWSGSFNCNALATTTFANPFTATGPSDTLRLAAGKGAELWLEFYGASSVGTGSITVTYTNQAGNTGRTTVFTVPNVNNRASAMVRIPLSTAAGIVDTGVRRVESVQVTAVAGAGANPITLVMANPIGDIGTGSDGTGQVFDGEATGLETIADNAALAFMLSYGGATGGNKPYLNGSYKIVQG